MKWLTNLDLQTNQLLNAVLHLLGSAPSSPVEGQVYYNTATHAAYVRTNSRWVLIDDSYLASLTAANSTITVAGTATAPTVKVATGGITDTEVSAAAAIAHAKIAAPVAAYSWGSQKLTNLADPTSAQDAATKNYVDAAAAGARDPNDSVRVATAAALPAYTRTGSVLTATANGALAAVDGVTLVAGDRLLLKNGAAGADNGIYTVTQGGTGGTPYILTRAADADSSAEVTAGLFVFVEEGTTNGDSGWLLTTDNPITLNTTALTFTQVSGLGQVTAGAGLTKTGNTLDVGAGLGIQVNANDVQIDTSVVARRYATDVGDGSSTAIVVTHNLGTRDVLVQLRDNTTPWAYMVCDVEATSTTTVTLRFAVAPTTAQYRAVVVG